jgi:hypothetical protein
MKTEIFRTKQTSTYSLVNICLQSLLNRANDFFRGWVHGIKGLSRNGIDKLVVDKETGLQLGCINGAHHLAISIISNE